MAIVPRARDLDFRLDDVFLPVALRRRNITGKLEIGQRRQCHIVGAADSRLQHPSAPNRNIEALGDVVHRNRFGESADPSHFDVDDAAGAQLQRGFGIAGAADGFVKAERGL